jgi:hypothetical protein
MLSSMAVWPELRGALLWKLKIYLQLQNMLQCLQIIINWKHKKVKKRIGIDDLKGILKAVSRLA